MTVADQKRAARVERRRKAKAPDLFSHRTRHVRVNASLMESETLVITFAPRATQADMIWGKAPFQKLGHSVLCFVDLADAWFPLADMRELRAAIAARLGGYRRIVTYGHSMGGYGALKYGRFLSAQRSVGLGPAWSVTPQDVGAFDQRRPRLYYRAGLHDDMAIVPGDLADEAIVVFDPKHKDDSQHVAAIERAGCDISRACNYFVGHDLLSPCVDGGNAQVFLREVASGEGVAGLRNVIRDSRARSPRYVSRALDAMHGANRFLVLRQNFAMQRAMPLAENHPAVRDTLVRRGYAVDATQEAGGWRAIFENGTADEAVKAAAGQPYSSFSSRADARRFLTVHGQAEAFTALNAFCVYLCEQSGMRGNLYVVYADTVLKSGRTRAHFAAADMLLAQAAAANHSAEKLTLLQIGTDLVLRDETAVPAYLFSSATFDSAEKFDRFTVPQATGEFMRSRAVDLGSGRLKIIFAVEGSPQDLRGLSCDVLGKNGRSLRSWWSVALETGRSFWNRRQGAATASPALPSVTIRMPRRKLRERRVNIILKSDGSASGRQLGFHGVTVARV